MTEISAIFGREVTTAILRSVARDTSDAFPIFAELPIDTDGIQIIAFVARVREREIHYEKETLYAYLWTFTQHIHELIDGLTGSILTVTLEHPFAAIFQTLQLDLDKDRR